MIFAICALLVTYTGLEHVKTLPVPYSLELWPGPNGTLFTSGIEDRKNYLTQWDTKGSSLRRYEIAEGCRYAGLDDKGAVCFAPDMPIRQSSGQGRSSSTYVSRYLYLDGSLLVERGRRFTLLQTRVDFNDGNDSFIPEGEGSFFALRRDRKEIAFLTNARKGATISCYSLSGKRLSGGLLRLTNSEWQEPFFHDLCLDSLKDGRLVGMAYVTRSAPKHEKEEIKAFIALVHPDKKTVTLLHPYPSTSVGPGVDYAFDPGQRCMAILEDRYLAILRTTTAIELFRFK